MHDKHNSNQLYIAHDALPFLLFALNGLNRLFTNY
uniref:Uncharacterized protein n=1 Tax=Myoviridae sp. ctWXg38 TaxID=2825119 RepID=A0A8S5PNH1_9CAUD|nr:MAG TPA: hypothetical protein [Myoviridae sp. ctWXg38]